MLFSVIYSADVHEDAHIDDFAPPRAEELWDQTEDGETEYSYLEGAWENGRHRKWAGLLTREQFDEFVEATGLYAESTETMGSLGAPGFGFGWAPAISFTSDDPDAIQSAYVTPIPEVTRPRSDERDWDRVKGAVLAVYG
jgi:hypothetical protein